jgi:PAS domain S-box-containing protein
VRQGSEVVPDLGPSSPRVEAPGGIEARSVLTVPLRAGGELIGLFALGKQEPGYFNREHLRRAESLAGQGAAAIANARLYERSRRDQEALRASELLFQKAFRSSPLAMAISRLGDGRYVEVNEAFTRFTGHDREAAVGRNGADLGVWDDPNMRTAMLESLRRFERISGFECRMITKSGQKRIGLMFAETVDIGTETHVLSAMLDVTEARRLEDQVRHAQRMEAIGRLAGGVAHDFNNMMMVIGARCELLAQEGAGDLGLVPALEEIQAVVKSAASLSRQLLTFSRKQTLRPQVLDLGDLCEQSLRMLRRLIPSNIEIRFERASRAARVRADPSSLEQVVMNLCVNARDAMPEGGLLTLDTAEVVLAAPLQVREGSLPPGRYARLRVADSGVGMDASTLDQIFDPFFTTKEEGKGTGLGLSVAYGVVRQSGGAILVESVPGNGAVFTVYLPGTEEPLEAAAPAPSPRAAGSETVLLVEDHDALRAVIGQYLEAAGFSVLVAEDGKAALDLVQGGKAHVDLLVTDVIMPGMTGRQLAETLAALHPGLRVIFLSGHPRDVISPDGTLPEWSRYLEKPYPLPDLVRQIRSFLDAPRPG